jgi:hypothetical protein
VSALTSLSPATFPPSPAGTEPPAAKPEAQPSSANPAQIAALTKGAMLGNVVRLPQEPRTAIFFSDKEAYPNASPLEPDTCLPVYRGRQTLISLYLSSYLPDVLSALCMGYLVDPPLSYITYNPIPFQVELFTGNLPPEASRPNAIPQIAETFIVFLNQQMHWANLKMDFRETPIPPRNWMLLIKFDTQCQLLSAPAIFDSPRRLFSHLPAACLTQAMKTRHFVMDVAFISTRAPTIPSKWMVFHFLQVDNPKEPSEADWTRALHLSEASTSATKLVHTIDRDFLINFRIPHLKTRKHQLSSQHQWTLIWNDWNSLTRIVDVWNIPHEYAEAPASSSPSQPPQK